MGTDRNAPCPCGSGKKYKKCHGLASSQAAKTPPDKLEVNRVIAYKGEVGRRREAFCAAYATAKKATLAAVAERLQQEAATNDKTISCGRGCSHCCKMFVVASLQECEAIVHHLYYHEPTLRLFRRNFARWNERILKIESSFRRINAIHARMTAGEASEAESNEFDTECDRYALQDIPCPFLADNACAIYEVRPYVCARIVAVTPSEWCRAGHPRQTEAMHLKAQMQFEKDMPYFTPLASDCVFSSMPLLVYRLLNDGYDALITVPGLEKLKDEAYNDPEVQAALKNLGVS
jgi:Fe-S-cluster containining protein